MTKNRNYLQGLMSLNTHIFFFTVMLFLIPLDEGFSGTMFDTLGGGMAREKKAESVSETSQHEKIDLNACFYFSTTAKKRRISEVYKNDMLNYPFPFRSVTAVDSIDDSDNCDVMINLIVSKEYLSLAADLQIEILSGYSKKNLKTFEMTKSNSEAVAERIIRSLSNGGILYAQIVAEREEYRRGVQAAVKSDQTKPIVTGLKPFISSDVDNPKYKNVENINDFALVIGVEKYSDLPEAQFAERDAESVKNHLLALGYPSRNIIQLAGNKAVKSALEKYLEDWLPKNVKQESQVFFYFSGHGAPDTKTGEAYLVPWDGDANFLERTAYPMKRLYEKLNALNVKQVVVALDTCFSGAGGRSVLAKGVRPLVTKIDTGITGNQKMISFSASNANEISGTVEDQGHGAFTYYFLKGLNGAAADKNGSVTIKALYDYLVPNVQDTARRQNRDQTPQLMPANLGDQSSIKLR